MNGYHSRNTFKLDIEHLKGNDVLRNQLNFVVQMAVQKTKDPSLSSSSGVSMTSESKFLGLTLKSMRHIAVKICILANI